VESKRICTPIAREGGRHGGQDGIERSQGHPRLHASPDHANDLHEKQGHIQSVVMPRSDRVYPKPYDKYTNDRDDRDQLPILTALVPEEVTHYEIS